MGAASDTWHMPSIGRLPPEVSHVGFNLIYIMRTIMVRAVGLRTERLAAPAMINGLWTIAADSEPLRALNSRAAGSKRILDFCASIEKASDTSAVLRISGRADRRLVRRFAAYGLSLQDRRTQPRRGANHLFAAAASVTARAPYGAPSSGLVGQEAIVQRHGVRGRRSAYRRRPETELPP